MVGDIGALIVGSLIAGLDSGRSVGIIGREIIGGPIVLILIPLNAGNDIFTNRCVILPNLNVVRAQPCRRTIIFSICLNCLGGTMILT